MGGKRDEDLGRLWDVAYSLLKIITWSPTDHIIAAMNLYTCHHNARPTTDPEELYQLVQQHLVDFPVRGAKRCDILCKLFSLRKGPIQSDDTIASYLSDKASLQLTAETTVVTKYDTVQESQIPRQLIEL